MSINNVPEHMGSNHSKLDIEHFNEKLKLEKNPIVRECIKKQIELLKDAIIIYYEHRLRDTD